VFFRGKETVLPSEEALWRDASHYAASITDSSFLEYVKTVSAKNYLHAATVECEKAAYTCLRAQLNSSVSGISQKIHSIQEELEEKKDQVTCEVRNEEEKELKVSRTEFVQKIEELSRERSKS
jgi:hypothetical protein